MQRKLTNTEDNKNKIENNIDNVMYIWLMTTELKRSIKDVSIQEKSNRII